MNWSPSALQRMLLALQLLCILLTSLKQYDRLSFIPAQTCSLKTVGALHLCYLPLLFNSITKELHSTREWGSIQVVLLLFIKFSLFQNNRKRWGSQAVVYFSKFKKKKKNKPWVTKSEINSTLYPQQQPTKSPLITSDISLWDSLFPSELCTVREFPKKKKKNCQLLFKW